VPGYNGDLTAVGDAVWVLDAEAQMTGIDPTQPT
jgi:hypothetical protein